MDTIGGGDTILVIAHDARIAVKRGPGDCKIFRVSGRKRGFKGGQNQNQVLAL
jgi:hypothetical protein